MALSYGPAVFPGSPTTTTFAGLFPGTQDIPGGTDYPGQPLTPADNLYPGNTTFAGQGDRPLVVAFYSTDGVSESTPVWFDATQRLRNFSISRGRESEQQQFDAGTATITLDNRDRRFDPTFGPPVITPMNRWWLYAEFSGEADTLFFGYAESYDQQWPNGGWSDAETVVSLVDEFKILSLGLLPSTSPPRDSYDGLVNSDLPQGYWRMNDAVETRVQTPEPPPGDDDMKPWEEAAETWSLVHKEWQWRGGWRW